MTTKFFDNFNFDPADNKEDSANYTVPAGMYAIVTVTLSVSSYGSVSGSDAIFGTTTSNSNSTSLELRLKEGSVITKLNSASSPSSTSAGTAGADGGAQAGVLVDGTLVSTISAGSSSFGRSESGITSVTASVTSSALVTWHISEYNKQGN